VCMYLLVGMVIEVAVVVVVVELVEVAEGLVLVEVDV
jgi:hypothetical protein